MNANDALRQKGDLGRALHRSRGGVVLVAVVVLVAGIVGVFSLGLHAGTSRVVNDQRPEVLPARRGVAVVGALREAGGWSLLGVHMADSTRYVEVRFLTEPACSGLLQSGDPWPTSFPQCSSPVKVVGTVRALGVATSGDALVGVEFEVSRACFELLGRGMAWPTADAACTVP